MVRIEEIIDPGFDSEKYHTTHDFKSPPKKRLRFEPKTFDFKDHLQHGKSFATVIEVIVKSQSAKQDEEHEHFVLGQQQKNDTKSEPENKENNSHCNRNSAKAPTTVIVNPIPVDGSSKNNTLPQRSKMYSIDSILEQAADAIKREKKKTKWDARWNDRLEELKEFKRKHGHCNVVPSHTEWKALGKWVYSQRHRRKEGQLSDEQVKLLDEIDFQWNLRPRKEKVWQENYFEFQCQPEITKTAVGISWDDRYKELEEFKKEQGHCNVSRYKKPWEKLGRWVYDQKRKKQKGSLAEYRVKKLETLGIDWQ